MHRLAVACLAALVPYSVAAAAGAVVGGTPATPSAYPWFAELPFCGGALIAPDRVATAAHRVAGLPPRDIPRVRLGSGDTRTATSISVHPAYVRARWPAPTTATRQPTTSRSCCSTPRSPA